MFQLLNFIMDTMYVHDYYVRPTPKIQFIKSIPSYLCHTYIQ